MSVGGEERDVVRCGIGEERGERGGGNVIVILRYKLQRPFTTFTARLVLRKTELVCISVYLTRYRKITNAAAHAISGASCLAIEPG